VTITLTSSTDRSVADYFTFDTDGGSLYVGGESGVWPELSDYEGVRVESFAGQVIENWASFDATSSLWTGAGGPVDLVLSLLAVCVDQGPVSYEVVPQVSSSLMETCRRYDMVVASLDSENDVLAAADACDGSSLDVCMFALQDSSSAEISDMEEMGTVGSDGFGNVNGANSTYRHDGFGFDRSVPTANAAFVNTTVDAFEFGTVSRPQVSSVYIRTDTASLSDVLQSLIFSMSAPFSYLTVSEPVSHEALLSHRGMRLSHVNGISVSSLDDVSSSWDDQVENAFRFVPAPSTEIDCRALVDSTCEATMGCSFVSTATRCFACHEVTSEDACANATCSKIMVSATGSYQSCEAKTCSQREFASCSAGDVDC